MSIEEIKEKIIPIAKEYGVGKVALFGSFANDIEDALGKSVDILTYKGIQNSIFKDSILEKEVVIYGT